MGGVRVHTVFHPVQRPGRSAYGELDGSTKINADIGLARSLTAVSGANRGNRTLILSLEDCGSTIELGLLCLYSVYSAVSDMTKLAMISSLKATLQDSAAGWLVLGIEPTGSHVLPPRYPAKWPPILFVIPALAARIVGAAMCTEAGENFHALILFH